MNNFIFTMVERPRPDMSTCSMNIVPGRRLLLESESGFEMEARGTKLFHDGQVDVSSRVFKTC